MFSSSPCCYCRKQLKAKFNHFNSISSRWLNQYCAHKLLSFYYLKIIQLKCLKFNKCRKRVLQGDTLMQYRVVTKYTTTSTTTQITKSLTAIAEALSCTEGVLVRCCWNCSVPPWTRTAEERSCPLELLICICSIITDVIKEETIMHSKSYNIKMWFSVLCLLGSLKLLSHTIKSCPQVYL